VLLGNRSEIKPVVPVIELKHVSLLGLWKATAQGNKKPSMAAQEKLRAEINADDEDGLLRRHFHYWDKEQKSWSKTSQSVADLKCLATTQVQEYVKCMSKGQGTSTSEGILDQRIQCQAGRDILCGYVVICIGDRVVFWRAIVLHTHATFHMDTSRMSNLGVIA
jgi:hypothetical protein